MSYSDRTMTAQFKSKLCRHIKRRGSCSIKNIVIRYKNMSSEFMTSNPGALLGMLAEFRFELRCFLHFSECAALKAGLQPQQHQLLLQVAGAPETTAVTIAYAAERLGLKHNSTVELLDRSVCEGLLMRTSDPVDRRRMLLRVTRKGRQILGRLAGDHSRELNEMAPRLERVLKNIRLHAQSSVIVEDK